MWSILYKSSLAAGIILSVLLLSDCQAANPPAGPHYGNPPLATLTYYQRSGFGHAYQERHFKSMKDPGVVNKIAADAIQAKKESVPRATRMDATQRDTQWTQYRRDGLLSGRSPLKAHMTGKPVVKWKQYIGARESLLGVRVSGSDADVYKLPSSDYHPGEYASKLNTWGLGPPTYDLDGTGVLTAVGSSYHEKIAKILPDVPGLQKVVFDTVLANGGDESVLTYGRLYVRKNGEWEQLWQSQAIPHLFGANPVVGDFDADGNNEIALTPWYDVYVLDARTGAVKTKATFKDVNAESGRPGGLFSALDLDGDGKKELVILSNSENHIDVMGWRNGQLYKVWGRLIGRGVTMKRTILGLTANPVADVDGDGKLEICVSVYNEKGDGHWHTQVIDGMTGSIKHDIVDQVIVGVCDINGDGISELFCEGAVGQSVPKPTKLTVYDCRSATPAVVWRENGATYQRELQQDTVTTMLSGPIVTGGLPVFFTRKNLSVSSGLVEIKIWQGNATGGITLAGTLAGPMLEALAVRPVAGAAGMLFKAKVLGAAGGSLTGKGVSCSTVSSRPSRAPVSPAVAGKLGDGPLTVVVEGAGERVIALQSPHKGAKPRIRWSVPGRGMFTGDSATGGGTPYGGFVIADLLGDGSQCVIAATRTPAGLARLVALTHEGGELWHHDFDDLPGAPPPWNVPGLCMWMTGHFTDPKRCDVFVNVRPNSYEGYLLDGRTGRQVWHVPSVMQSHCGGYWMGVADYDNDGLDDLVSMYPNIIYWLDGATGSLLKGVSTGWGGLFGTGAMSGIPVIADYLGNGQLQMFYSSSQYALGLLTLDTQVIWSKGIVNGVLPSVSYIVEAIGDFDGDGRMEIISQGYRADANTANQTLRCLDAATGDVKWSLIMSGNAATTAASADIDSDGREECLFGIDDALYCVGTTADGKAGLVKWVIHLPGDVSSPAIVDLDNSGEAQIVVTCSDGQVYGLGAP